MLGSKSDVNTVTESRSGRAAEISGGNGGGYALGIIAAACLIGILYWARIVFITATIAVVTALILEPFVSLLVKLRLPRGMASFVVCIFALLAVYFAGLATYNQISSVAGAVPAFKEHLGDFVARISDRIQALQDSSARILMPRKAAPAAAPAPQASAKKSRKPAPPPPNPATLPGFIPEVRIHDDRNPIVDYVYGQLGTLYQFALMASFVPLLVYFMLSWRDHVYQSFLRFFDGPDRVTAARSLQGIAGMARAFVVGNFMIGIIVAGLSCGVFALIRLPYAFLAGTLSGLLSLVPYAGLVLALLPPVLAALATGAPSTVLLIAAFAVIALHLAAMNVLYPTLVGARVHLNPLIVTFSLMFWGFLWDAAGLVLAIPITAGIKAVCDNVAGLRKYGRFLGD
jgi:predicted PurR-regulated permease PerM